LINENEEITVLEMSFEDALKMIENQEIVAARTLVLCYHLKVHNLI